MTDQFTRQVQEILSATKDARVPENVKALAHRVLNHPAEVLAEDERFANSTLPPA